MPIFFKRTPQDFSLKTLSVLLALSLQGCGGSDQPAIDPTADVCTDPITQAPSGPSSVVVVTSMTLDTATPTTSAGMPIVAPSPTVTTPTTPATSFPPTAAGTSPALAPTTPIPTTQIDRNQWNGKDVVIPVGTVVMLDANVEPKSLMVYGTLRCSDNRDLSITTNSIVVAGGMLECGTLSQPFSKKLTIALQGLPSEESVMGLGTKVLGAVGGGQINLIGVARKSWVKLSTTAVVGSNQLELNQPVDWKPGDRIVIASSVVADQSEEREVEQVTGSTVKLKTPLSYMHTGELREVAGVSFDLRAEVGLLTRDIKIEGDESSIGSQFGGHVMIAGKSSNARIQGVQFTRMGQFNRLGRYPMHWHHVRDASGGFFQNNSISHTLQRGVFVHATDNLRVESNVVYNTKGHSYGLENGTETGNVFIGNLGLGTRGAVLPNVTFEDKTSADDNQAATFWFVGGSNTFIGNSAAGSDHSGFWFERAGAVNEFIDNTAHSNAAGGRPGTNEQAGITTKASSSISGTLKNTLLYSNAVGAWFENGATVLNDAKLVDNTLATFSSVTLENSIVVGSSTNVATANEGLVTYNSPVVAKNVIFANFSGYSMRTFLGGPEGARFQTEGLKFFNVPENRRIMLQPGNAFAVDLDSSLIGRKGVLTPEEPSMYTPDCEVKAAWNTRICPTLYPYQSAFVGDPSKEDTLTRDDGSKQSLSMQVPFFTVMAGRKYTMNRALGNFSIWLDGAAGSTEFIVPATNARFDIFVCLYVGNCTDESKKLPAVTSLNQLEQSTGDSYFHDPNTARLHLKIFRWKQIVVRNS
jgi:hypothetical protein